jgi:NAD(P)-dependent dehydrogenase (short-subunit alcohol dehydrogenase family)
MEQAAQDAPERKDAESLGLGLFNESLEDWADLYALNTFSMFFVTTAFLGLLAKGSEDIKDYWSAVINITSISAHTKLAQNHVCGLLTSSEIMLMPTFDTQFCYNSAKAAASHLTKMLASEISLKKIPVRVNAIAPGVFVSEMTIERFSKGGLEGLAKGVMPVPKERDGS